MMIGETVKKLRERKGLSQKELGKMVGASQQNIAQLENNEVKQPRYLPALAKALGLSIEGLYAIAQGGEPSQATRPRLVKKGAVAISAHEAFVNEFTSLGSEDAAQVREFVQYLLWKRNQR